MSRNRKWKYRTPENCFNEIKKAKEKYKIKSFVVLDDCFNVSKKRAIEFCNLVKELCLPWECANGLRADLFDEELALALKEANCRQISFGAETINAEILIKIKKGETKEQIENAVKTAKKYFNNINCFFIIGIPGSSYETDLENLNWVKKMGINGHFSFFVPQNNNIIQYDKLFYGEKNEPLSNAYSIDLQNKVYQMTKLMRPDFEDKDIISKFNRLKLRIKRKIKNLVK